MKSIDEVNSILRHMHGATATLWSYSSSLEELNLRLQFPRANEAVDLICNGCSWLQAPTAWLNSTLALTGEGSDGSNELLDETVSCRIRCKFVRILRLAESGHKGE